MTKTGKALAALAACAVIAAALLSPNLGEWQTIAEGKAKDATE